jgi:glutamate formiminotransferase / 5-formyltetrahydrofolate cyclo-ligase
MTLLAVPNVSEGRDAGVLAAIGDAFVAGGARLVHASADPDHHRAVFTLAGEPGRLAPAVVAGAREAATRIDVRAHAGEHPRVGAVDVAPIVHLDGASRGAACAEALVLADGLAEALDAPVFLYGALAGGRTRAALRRGGPEALAARIASGELVPDAGPRRLHPTAGAVLVAARPPLGAFNLWLAASASLDDARAAAARVRAPDGLPGVRALGLALGGAGAVQVSTNVEDLHRVPLAAVLAAVQRHVPVARAELVAPVPRAALAGWPPDVPLDAPPPLEELLSGV